MRYQGRIADWKDDKGFGFVTPNGGGERAFVHIHAFTRRGRRPVDGDVITFEIGLDEHRRPRAAIVRFANDDDSSPRREYPVSRRRAHSSGNRVGNALIAGIVLAIGGLLVYQAHHGGLAQLNPRPPPEERPFEAQSLTGEAGFSEGPSKFKCDGRTGCSQMTSCNEANYFLKNCPEVKMDGDGDGVACESQWCN